MPEIDDLARELVLLVRGLKGLHRTVVSEAGIRLELPAAAVLTCLDERGRQRASALAEVLHLDLSTVSRQVAALEREGWVSRERDPADSRAALLELTDEGRAVLSRVRGARVALLTRLLPGWSADELRHLADQMHRLRTDLLAAPAPASPTTHRTPALAGQESA